MKRVLMVCYYFPPLGMGGTQRPAKFAKYLPEFGWEPVVLTVKPIAYWARDPDMLRELAHVDIYRTGSLDPQRMLALAGSGKEVKPVVTRSGGLLQALNRQVLPWIVLPDTKMLWAPFAVHTAKSIYKHTGFDAVYSTSPPHSAHLIARRIRKTLAIPWVADFRDSWAGSVVVHEPTALHRRVHRKMQAGVVRDADAVVAVSEGIRDVLGRTKRAFVIHNGFDPADFPAPSLNRSKKFVFCHCGSITEFSFPDVLLAAVQAWLRAEPGFRRKLEFRFIGQDMSGKLQDLIRSHGLQDMCSVSGYRTHRRALQTMVDADALILIARGRADLAFIPGKTFEYLGSRKPIVVISDVPDTLALTGKHDLVFSAAPDSTAGIIRCLKTVVDAGPGQLRDPESVSRFERRAETARLADILNQMVKG